MPPIESHFITIAEIQDLKEKKEIDLIAIVLENSEPKTYGCSDGINREKRTLRLVDDTEYTISLGLWTDQAKKLDDAENKVVRLQNVLVGEYNRKKVLNSTVNTIAEVFEDTSNSTVQQLLEWWSAEGPHEEFTEIPADL